MRMAVLSTNRLVSGLGAVGLGAVGFLLWRKSLRDKGLACQVLEEGSSAGASNIDPAAPISAEGNPKLKTRIGNFKISKVKRMVEGLAEDFGEKVEFDWDTVKNLHDSHSSKDAISSNDQSEWDKQVNTEQQTFLDAAEIVGEIRRSGTHRKLPHFHVVDRQLGDMEAHFRELSEDVLIFPWRECRNEPMSELMELPFMQLAKDHRSLQSLLPVSQGYVKQTVRGAELDCTSATACSDAEDGQRVEDEALLRVAAGADRQTLESAFRHKARSMHVHGHCVMMDAFHALNNAYGRCLARLAGSISAYRGGGDILAHYLLVGMDPSESRYGEAPDGLLDALRRDRLLMRISVLRMWGEDERSGTGLGQG
eukprot:TRINITY_DN89421_c0_g1_i1.p1 TRINITY_DN89421_c0_g1~~TRINITY_DN89421_c0_g1_i1.p1  ORF type:complete len:367 (+),score=62.75 TRINITY_DN89421_c0_g1_i1:64-1164(+)